MNNPVTIVTGDLANNFARELIPQYGTQFREDFDIYLKMTKDRLLKVGGNHDFFGVYAFDSEESVYARHKKWTEDEMLLSIEKVEIGGEMFSLILGNAVHFPAPHPPLQAWVRATVRFLNLLEDALDRADPNSTIVFCAHFPFNYWKLHKQSKKGRTIEEILTDGRVKLFLTGHVHPAEPVFLHHGAMMEVLGADLKGHRKMGVLTVDNGRIGYHSVKVEEPSLVFVTNPVDKNHLFLGQVFNEANTSLRLIAFTEEAPDVRVNGSVQGRLSCSRTPAFWLCSCPLGLPPGDHSVQFHGDFNSTLDFIIANKTRPLLERVYFGSYVKQIYISIIALFVLLLVISTPCHFSGTTEKRYLAWIADKPEADRSFWLFSFVLGFISARMRIAQLPRVMQWSLFLLVFAPLCCPLVITSIEGHIGGIWIFGHICGGHADFYVAGGLLVLFYQVVILLPLVVVYSAIGAPRHSVQFVDLGFGICAIAGLIVLDLKYPGEATGPARAAIAPLMSLAPTWLYGLAAWELWRERVRENVMKSGSGSALLADQLD
jgi:hypothetical protein